jgi:ABC-type transport system substrate-binding protein
MADLPRAVLGDDRQVPVNQRRAQTAPTTTRRDFLRALSLFGIGVAAAACTPTASPASAPTAMQSGPTVTPAPRLGGVLRMGIIGDFPSLEGETVTPIAQDNLWGVWDRLIAQDVTTQPKPMLAERWDISPDYSQITFHLRKGVKFHTLHSVSSVCKSRRLARRCWAARER